MAVDVTAVKSEVAERERFEVLLGKILPVAKVADAIARRSVGKVGAIAWMGMLAAAWLSWACAQTFEWGLAPTLTMLVTLALPSLLLWKIHSMLKSAVGLPARVSDTFDRLFGKFAEYRQLYAERAAAPAGAGKPRFRELWRTARSLYELKTLGDEGQELLVTLGGAMAMTNPLFAVVLFVSMIIAMLIVFAAAIVGLAFMF